MRGPIFRCAAVVAVALLSAVPAVFAMQANTADPPQAADSAPQAGGFHWVDFHSPKDQSVVIWVTRSLAVEDWSAIREIGVKYDAALVVTTHRASPTSLPGSGAFNVWNVSLTSHQVTPVLKGVNLRWLAWVRLSRDAPLEPAVLYENCRQCAANTYFTTFHYRADTHQWTARWTKAGEGVAIWNTDHPAGMQWTQVYAVMTGENGVSQLVTWNHFDYGKDRPPEDSIFRYDVDPFSGLDRNQIVSGKQAEAMKTALCNAQNAVTGLARGQNSELCQEVLHTPQFRKPLRGVPERRLAPPHTPAPPKNKDMPKVP